MDKHKNMHNAANRAKKIAQEVDFRPLRIVTAASLFDGHDAAINIMRRIIQQQGAEVIHLGHNRSVDDVVRAALQEDADAIAISSYQGGHMEYFRYMVDQLKSRGAEQIRIFGGGGGTITPDEIAELQHYGVERIYHPNDGMQMGLVDMIRDLMQRTEKHCNRDTKAKKPGSNTDDHGIAKMISGLENKYFDMPTLENLRGEWRLKMGKPPVLGITGTGGAGKSSLLDELLIRFLHYFPDIRIAVIAVDPTRRRSGGALLGDRIRINSLSSEQIYMRSIATRRQHLATSEILDDSILLLKSSGFDLVMVETAGIGQSDTEIVDLVDFSVYVMTSDYGAASQLEKIDMVDYADMITLNKYDKRGSEDALRDIRKQWQRNRNAFDLSVEDIPVYPAIASQFNDPGVNWLFYNLCHRLTKKLKLTTGGWYPEMEPNIKEPKATTLIPDSRIRYLAEIAEQASALDQKIENQCAVADRAYGLYQTLKLLNDSALTEAFKINTIGDKDGSELSVLRHHYCAALSELSEESKQLLKDWPGRRQGVEVEAYQYQVRGVELKGENYRESLSHLKIPKISPPEFNHWGELLRFLLKENLPGYYPFTAGVYPYRRESEDPIRMFAGEGTPERTNRRFHYLSVGQPASRLSTAFDSVTLYGQNPATKPDIYGKIGNAGVSVATLDDMKKLYSGFDLCAPSTSVSMTINGPAPMILAFFMNAAIDQQVEKYLKQNGLWEKAEKKIQAWFTQKGIALPQYYGTLPETHDRLGLGLLGISGDCLLDSEVYGKIKAETLRSVRGTVQADILKEDQAQNTCIFSTEFALKMMGDVQQYFIDHEIRNYYSVSISGYHIAEAGANPVTQLAFTLANGFTIVEYYLARGMKIDDFAPNLSFFFSNGMDPEYAVIGRVARRIWARAMRERYGASTRSQMLKYHIQTSGRSLHAQEIQFNDIRTTLQALYAIFDNCNSLHTNAYDEAITTPTEESVRRAMAIQLIINRELGLNYNENPWQGSFAINRLTDMVEEVVYKEFKRISERGGVLGAMDSMYQRGKIQEESMLYEEKKHNGSLPIIGVNTFLPKERHEDINNRLELARSNEAEKKQQIDETCAFHQRYGGESALALGHLKKVARAGKNIFSALMDTTKTCSLGQISAALYEVGGEYRRNM